MMDYTEAKRTPLNIGDEVSWTVGRRSPRFRFGKIVRETATQWKVEHAFAPSGTTETLTFMKNSRMMVGRYTHHCMLFPKAYGEARNNAEDMEHVRTTNKNRLWRGIQDIRVEDEDAPAKLRKLAEEIEELRQAGLLVEI